MTRKKVAVASVGAALSAAALLYVMTPAPQPPVTLAELNPSTAVIRIEPATADRYEVTGGVLCACRTRFAWREGDATTLEILWPVSTGNHDKERVMVVSVDVSDDGKRDLSRVTIQPEARLIDIPRTAEGRRRAVGK